MSSLQSIVPARLADLPESVVPSESAMPAPYCRLPPELSAETTVTPAQAAVVVFLLTGLVVLCLEWSAGRVFHAFNEGMMAFYVVILIHRAGLLIAGALYGRRSRSAIQRTRQAIPPVPDVTAVNASMWEPNHQTSAAAAVSPLPNPELPNQLLLDRLPLAAELPRISILVPLYHEAGVVAQIVGALSRMKYPTDRLEVLLLLEEDDRGTREACNAAALPPHIRTVTVPEGSPRTKPRACNYGLEVCEGDIVVVYDAEDQPEIDQLLVAAGALAAAPPNVACVQARLAYYNPRQNLLTRWFAAEYMAWFELTLPGLHAVHAPIPLGGTSNFFRAETLRACGGWDAWNVAEDCDLGMRLSRCGYRVWPIDSTTWEEACPRVPLWIRQRSRWVKGYFQTWLVHSRSPLRLFRELGIWQFLNMQLLVGGSVACLLINPVYWLLTLLWWTHPTPWESTLMGGPTLALGNLSFTLGNALFISLQGAGALRRKQWDLAILALLAPIYWLMMSVAAWKAVLQLVVAPHHWEKTIHGLAHAPPADPLPAPEPPLDAAL